MIKIRVFFTAVILMIFAVITISGCTGFTPNVVVNNITDTGFVLMLQNNPDLKPGVLKALEATKLVLAKDSLTYQDLLANVTSLFKEKYGFVFYLLMRNIESDIPIIQNPLSAEYRAGVSAKIDDLVFLATTFVK